MSGRVQNSQSHPLPECTCCFRFFKGNWHKEWHSWLSTQRVHHNEHVKSGLSVASLGSLTSKCFGCTVAWNELFILVTHMTVKELERNYVGEWCNNVILERPKRHRRKRCQGPGMVSCFPAISNGVYGYVQLSFCHASLQWDVCGIYISIYCGGLVANRSAQMQREVKLQRTKVLQIVGVSFDLLKHVATSSNSNVINITFPLLVQLQGVWHMAHGTHKYD